MKKKFCCNFCNGKSFSIRFEYDSPPVGETKFELKNQNYKRHYVSCNLCGHWFSQHEIDLKHLYSEEYMNKTYNDKISEAFEKIISMPREKSDNFDRIKRIKMFAESLFLNKKPIYLLDIGSGLGVFPYSVKNIGWNCTAIDPDKHSVSHIKKRIGIKTIHGEFMKIKNMDKYNVITLNKVLEHVTDPIAMLKKAKNNLLSDGFIYVEVPDAEEASKEGKNREEFFIDHIHVFSKSSLIYMCKNAGLQTIKIERINEPSGKFTLFAFISFYTSDRKKL
jgi:2-polyprenyl-3-methyl-5-hydroxy-6-metoxy-1,4-benzoquinol methylase